jgi:hypothetical protein
VAPELSALSSPGSLAPDSLPVSPDSELESPSLVALLAVVCAEDADSLASSRSVSGPEAQAKEARGKEQIRARRVRSTTLRRFDAEKRVKKHHKETRGTPFVASRTFLSPRSKARLVQGPYCET